MADSGATDLEGFRGEARAWIAANFPPALKGGTSLLLRDDGHKATPEQDAWRKAMGEKGWGAPTWPKAYGGGGLSREEAGVLQQELTRVQAYNPIISLGTVMFGPTLLEYGTEAQKLEHIPPIVRGEVLWCQGFSEPGAGSDLAGLQMKAEDKGDHFVLNGQKVWTSGAQFADWCFCLIRTDTTKKQDGISFVLLPIHQPGVEVRPIPLISGASLFCEMFFTDAVAQKKDLVGPLNGGWAVAKRLLQHERSGLSGGGTSTLFGTSTPLDVLAKSYVGTDEAGRIADTDLRARIMAYAIDMRAYQQTATRAMLEAKSNAGPSAAISIMKNAGARLTKRRADLAIEILGSQGLGWEGEGYTDDEIIAIRGWLFGRASTIFGGTEEVQDNIIAKRILGLPDAAKSAGA